MPFLFLSESQIDSLKPTPKPLVDRQPWELKNLLPAASIHASTGSTKPSSLHRKLKTLHPNPRPQKPTTTPGDRISRPPQRRRPLSPEPQSLCCCCSSFLFLPQRLPTWPCDLSPRHSIISVHRGPNPKLQTADPLENVRARREMHADRRALARPIDLCRCRRWACTCWLGRAGTGGLSVRCSLARLPQSGQSQASVTGP